MRFNNERQDWVALLSYCGELVRSGDHDRFLAALFAPEPARMHLFTLSAFNLEIARIQEQVSEPLLGEIRLQWWREGIEAIYAQQPARNHPVLQVLQHTIEQCALPRQPFDALIDAYGGLFANPQPGSLTELEGFVDATGGGLMRLALAVLGEGASDDMVRHAALAFGLTGVLRNVGFHATQHRILLPRDLMQAEGLTEDMIFNARMGPQLRAVMAVLSARAKLHLDAARNNFPPPARRILPALLPVVLTKPYLARIATPDYDAFVSYPAMPAFLRQSRLLWAMARGRL